MTLCYCLDPTSMILFQLRQKQEAFMILKLGLPKGSLQESTFNIFKKAGFNINSSSRSYYPGVDDPEISITLVRAQEMARYVAEGVFDAGLTGYEWMVESGRASWRDSSKIS